MKIISKTNKGQRTKQNEALKNFPSKETPSIKDLIIKKC